MTTKFRNIPKNIEYCQ